MRRSTLQILLALALVATGLLSAGSGLSLGLHDRFAHGAPTAHAMHSGDEAGAHAPHSQNAPTKEHRAHDCPVCSVLTTLVIALAVAFVLAGVVETLCRVVADLSIASQTRFRFDAPSRAPPALA